MTDYTQHIGKVGWIGEPNGRKKLGVLRDIQITTSCRGEGALHFIVALSCQRQQGAAYFEDEWTFLKGTFTPITLDEWMEIGKQLITDG